MVNMKKFVAFMVLLLGIGMIYYAGDQLSAAAQVYQVGNEAYDALSDQVRTIGPADAKAPLPQQNPADAPTVQNARVHIPQLTIDFAALKAINEDAAAWLYSTDTVIDYPIMKADDYSYYLHHLPDGAFNANGSLFIDYNNAADFSEPLTVIYGHHMKSGKMFGGLKGYKDQKHYEKHPYMYLYTEQGNYRVELLYGCVIGAGQWRDRAFMYAANIDALLAYAAHNTTFTSEASYTDGDRVIALSTCSYEFDDARYVVLGVLRSENN
jgi:sortase B